MKSPTINILPFSAAVLIGLSSAPVQASVTLVEGLLRDFTAVTTGDYTIRNADTEGRLLVNGTFRNLPTSAAPVNAQVTNPDGGISLYARNFSLASGTKVRVQNGGVITPSSIDRSRFDLQQQGATFRNSSNGGGSAFESLFQSYGTTSSGLATAVHAGSIDLANRSSNGTITNSGSQNPRFVAGDGLVIFDIAAADIFAQNINPELQISSGNQAVVINVSGTNIQQAGGQNFNGGFTQDFGRSRVIWNFYEATEVDLNVFQGSILAPKANVWIGEGNGSIISKSLTHTGELHLPTFRGMIVPEPSSALFSAMIIGLMGLARRRR